jgi:hypothetical protein
MFIEGEEVAGPAPEARRVYSDSERLERACLRVAMHIRGLWEEKGSSDTRLLEALLIPDELTVVGRSVALAGSTEKGRREHVVPRRVIVQKCHEMLKAKRGDQDLAAIIRDYTKIVWITEAERQQLDRVEYHGLRQSMPAGWDFDGDPFRRLKEANIAWTPVVKKA